MFKLIQNNPKKAASLTIIILSLLILFALRSCYNTQKIKPDVFSVGLKRYKGQFVTFQYPSSAQIKVISPKESFILGPIVTLKAPSPTDNETTSTNTLANSPNAGSAKYAYQIHIQVHDNPMKLRTDDWIQDHLISEWKQTQGGPNILPVTHDGHIMTDFVTRVRVGKTIAIMVDIFGQDSNTRSLYFAKDNVVIEMSFTLYPQDSDPLALMQKDIYALILGTLDLAH